MLALLLSVLLFIFLNVLPQHFSMTCIVLHLLHFFLNFVVLLVQQVNLVIQELFSAPMFMFLEVF